MANRQFDWEIIQRGDANPGLTTLPSLYAVSTQAQVSNATQPRLQPKGPSSACARWTTDLELKVLGLMQRIVDGIRNPRRPIPDPERNNARVQEIPFILDRIRDLWSGHPFFVAFVSAWSANLIPHV